MKHLAVLLGLLLGNVLGGHIVIRDIASIQNAKHELREATAEVDAMLLRRAVEEAREGRSALAVAEADDTNASQEVLLEKSESIHAGEQLLRRRTHLKSRQLLVLRERTDKIERDATSGYWRGAKHDSEGCKKVVNQLKESLRRAEDEEKKVLERAKRMQQEFETAEIKVEECRKTINARFDHWGCNFPDSSNAKEMENDLERVQNECVNHDTGNQQIDILVTCVSSAQFYDGGMKWSNGESYSRHHCRQSTTSSQYIGIEAGGASCKTKVTNDVVNQTPKYTRSGCTGSGELAIYYKDAVKGRTVRNFEHLKLWMTKIQEESSGAKQRAEDARTKVVNAESKLKEWEGKCDESFGAAFQSVVDAVVKVAKAVGNAIVAIIKAIGCMIVDVALSILGAIIDVILTAVFAVGSGGAFPTGTPYYGILCIEFKGPKLFKAGKNALTPVTQGGNKAVAKAALTREGKGIIEKQTFVQSWAKQAAKKGTLKDITEDVTTMAGRKQIDRQGINSAGDLVKTHGSALATDATLDTLNGAAITRGMAVAMATTPSDGGLGIKVCLGDMQDKGCQERMKERGLTPFRENMGLLETNSTTTLGFGFSLSAAIEWLFNILMTALKWLGSKPCCGKLKEFLDSGGNDVVNIIFWFVMRIWEGFCGKFGTVLMNIVKEFLMCNMCAICPPSACTLKFLAFSDDCKRHYAGLVEEDAVVTTRQAAAFTRSGLTRELIMHRRDEKMLQHNDGSWDKVVRSKQYKVYKYDEMCGYPNGDRSVYRECDRDTFQGMDGTPFCLDEFDCEANTVETLLEGKYFTGWCKSYGYHAKNACDRNKNNKKVEETEKANTVMCCAGREHQSCKVHTDCDLTDSEKDYMSFLHYTGQGCVFDGSNGVKCYTCEQKGLMYNGTTKECYDPEWPGGDPPDVLPSPVELHTGNDGWEACHEWCLNQDAQDTNKVVIGAFEAEFASYTVNDVPHEDIPFFAESPLHLTVVSPGGDVPDYTVQPCCPAGKSRTANSKLCNACECETRNKLAALRYGKVVAIFNPNHKKVLAVSSDGSVSTTAVTGADAIAASSEGERFRVVRGGSPDDVAFYSTKHRRFLVMGSDGAVRTTSVINSEDLLTQRGTDWPYVPITPYSSREGTRIGLRGKNAKYLGVLSSGAVTATAASLQAWEEFQFVEHTAWQDSFSLIYPYTGRKIALYNNYFKRFLRCRKGTQTSDLSSVYNSASSYPDNAVDAQFTIVMDQDEFHGGLFSLKNEFTGTYLTLGSDGTASHTATSAGGASLFRAGVEGGVSAATATRSESKCCWNRRVQSCATNADCDGGGEGCITSGTRTAAYGNVGCDTCESKGLVMQIANGAANCVKPGNGITLFNKAQSKYLSAQTGSTLGVRTKTAIGGWETWTLFVVNSWNE